MWNAQNRKTHGGRKQISGGQQLGEEGWGVAARWVQRFLWGDKNVLELESGIDCTVSLIVNFTLCGFYQNKNFLGLLEIIVHQALYTCFISSLLRYEAGEFISQLKKLRRKQVKWRAQSNITKLALTKAVWLHGPLSVVLCVCSSKLTKCNTDE